MAGLGRFISFVCREDQVAGLLREIAYYDGVIIRKETTAEGILITTRKT